MKFLNKILAAKTDPSVRDTSGAVADFIKDLKDYVGMLEKGFKKDDPQLMQRAADILAGTLWQQEQKNIYAWIKMVRDGAHL